MRRVREVSASVVLLRINVAEHFGVNRQIILNRAKIDSSIFSDLNAKVSLQQMKDVWRIIVDETKLETLGLECGIRGNPSSLGILGYAIMNARNIREGMERFCQYQRLVASVIFASTQSKEGKYAKYEFTLQEPWEEVYRYTIDYFIASSYTNIKNLTLKCIVPVEVGFNYAKPANLERYHDLFGTKNIKFSCKKPYLLYKKKDLETPLLIQNPALSSHFEKQLNTLLKEHDEVNFYKRAVVTYITNHFGEELPKIDDVARDMAISVRSLQNYLKESNTSFQKLLNTVRNNFSLKYLKDLTITISEIAFLMGFSDVSSFSRFFKRKNGISPRQFRYNYHRNNNSADCSLKNLPTRELELVQVELLSQTGNHT